MKDSTLGTGNADNVSHQLDASKVARSQEMNSFTRACRLIKCSNTFINLLTQQ